MNNMNIFTTYHHSFAGGSKNTSRLLNYIAQNNHSINAFFFEKPQFFEYTRTKIQIHNLGSNNISSEVIDLSLLKNYSATQKIIDELSDVKHPILFTSNLFPYCDIMHDVKSQLTPIQRTNTKLIIHPVGSDIWQIGPQMKSRVKWLLDSPLVDRIITYSPGFVSEIKEYFNIKKDIHVLSPVLEKERFFQIGAEERTKRRLLLGLNEDDFIIHHHSSMRKIKCPGLILKIAIRSAEIIKENCILIMVGPIPYEEISSLNLNLIKSDDNTPFIYKTRKGKLTILWTGVLTNVEHLMQISDVELNASIHDSFNISLMEAMACGLPVVTSDIVGIKPHIDNAKSGICLPTKKLTFDELNKALTSDGRTSHLVDIDYAISSMVSLANDSNGAKTKGNAGAKYVSAEFCVEKIAKEFVSILADDNSN